MVVMKQLVAITMVLICGVQLLDSQYISCYSCEWDQISGCQSKAKVDNNQLMNNCTVCQKVATPYVTGLAAAKGELIVRV